jgi:hypothetical protein
MAAPRTVGDILDDLPPIGHNRASLSAFEAVQIDIADLADLARNTLDGIPLANKAQAAAVQSLVDQARKASGAADKAREADKAPHLKAGREVDTRYKPLITEAERIVSAGKVTLQPWLVALQSKQRAEAAEAQRIADEATAAALAKHQAANPASLESREDADRALADAGKAQADAKRAAAARAVASSGEGRGIGLRSYWEADMTEPHLYLAHLKHTAPERLKVALAIMMMEDVRAGARSLPGCVIREEQRAA